MAALHPDRMRKFLTDIRRSLDRLRRLRAMSREDFLSHEDSQDVARSRLLTAIEAALNVCYHVAARKVGRVPEEYAQCFKILGEAGLLPPDLTRRLMAMARFRNRLVHLYWDVDYGQVYDVMQRDMEDLEEFARHAASWLEMPTKSGT